MTSAQQKICVRRAGIVSGSIGALALAPALMLVNQEFPVVRVPWGIFNVTVNGVTVSNSTVAAVGLALIVLGVTLVRR